MLLTKFSLVFVLLMVFVGCTDEDNPVVAPPATPPGVASPDLVAEKYVADFTHLDQEALDNLLAPDYQMILSADTAQLYPNIGSTFDRAAQLRVANRLFARNPLTDPDGNLVPGNSAIVFDRFEQVGDWTDAPAGGEFAGSRQGLFDVLVTCTRPGFSSLRTTGQLVLYVADADTVIDGTSHTYWQLSGLQDLTGNGFKKIADISWGEIQALYWVPE